jgi:hypothetical protein
MKLHARGRSRRPWSDPADESARADPRELEHEMECFVEPEEAFTRDEIE